MSMFHSSDDLVASCLRCLATAVDDATAFFNVVLWTLFVTGLLFLLLLLVFLDDLLFVGIR